jgi:hypothetical protein
VRVEIGPPASRRLFVRFLQMDPLRKNFAPAPVDSLRSRLADMPGDGFEWLANSRDSLLLTAGQIERIKAADVAYNTRVDPMWQELAVYIAAQGENANLRDVNRRLDEAKVRAWAIQREEIQKMMAPLSPAQRELAEVILEWIINSDKRRPPSRAIF